LWTLHTDLVVVSPLWKVYLVLHPVLLIAHVSAGTIGLLIGPLALATPKRARRHPRLGLAYQAAVAAMAFSALGLVALAPVRLWGLGVIAMATEAAALAGWRVRRRHAPGWLGRHVRLMCGSYVSLVTAALVVNWASPAAWVLPTLIAIPLINRAVRRAVDPGTPVRRTDVDGDHAMVASLAAIDAKRPAPVAHVPPVRLPVERLPQR
jgi:hypothetical protein